MDKKRKYALLEALIGNSIFGFSFMFSKRALAVAKPDMLLCARFTVAFLLLNLLMLTGKFKLNFKNKPIKYLIILGIFQPILYFICETKGLEKLNTSLVGILISVIPMVASIMSSLFLHEKLGRFKVICIVVSIIGVLLTTFGQGIGNFDFKGVLLILGAVFSAAIYDIMARISSNDFSSFEKTYMMFALGCAFFLTTTLFRYGGSFAENIIVPLKNFDFWISILFLAGLSSVGAFLLLNHAIHTLEVSEFAVFANITTVISILAGIFFLKEQFNIYQIIGSIVIILGIYGVNRKNK